MKFETDLKEDFGYPDDVQFTNRIKRDIAIISTILIITVCLILLAVYHADSIDLFFKGVYKWMTL